MLDYCHDTQLEFGRLDFLKRLDLDGAKALMAAGADYARRQDEAGVLEKYLGAVKRGKRTTTMSEGGVILPTRSVQTPEAGLAA